jgi:hypothetical protein
MAVFSNDNIQGANAKLNKSLTDAKALKDSLLANHGGDASTILASLQSKVNDLVSSFADMIPELCWSITSKLTNTRWRNNSD